MNSQKKQALGLKLTEAEEKLASTNQILEEKRSKKSQLNDLLLSSRRNYEEAETKFAEMKG